MIGDLSGGLFSLHVFLTPANGAFALSGGGKVAVNEWPENHPLQAKAL